MSWATVPWIHAALLALFWQPENFDHQNPIKLTPKKFFQDNPKKDDKNEKQQRDVWTDGRHCRKISLFIDYFISTTIFFKVPVLGSPCATLLVRVPFNLGVNDVLKNSSCRCVGSVKKKTKLEKSEIRPLYPVRQCFCSHVHTATNHQLFYKLYKTCCVMKSLKSKMFGTQQKRVVVRTENGTDIWMPRKPSGCFEWPSESFCRPSLGLSPASWETLH